MADALCGPSNALQAFQKHTAVDRTLQQDRLTSRRQQAEGFRSQSPHTGILDHEFETFQSQSGAAFASPHLSHPLQQQFHNQPPQLAPAAPSWSADFQRLRLSTPSPSAAAARFVPQSNHQQVNSGWHHDFLQANNSSLLNQQATRPPQTANSFQPWQPQFHPATMGSTLTSFGQPTYANDQQFQAVHAQQDTWSAHQESQVEQAKVMEDFEREFEAYDSIVSEPQHEESQEDPSTEIGQDILMNDLREQARAMNAVSFENLREQFREDAAKLRDENIHGPEVRDFSVVHDVLPRHEEGEVQPQKDDADELAQTAGEILDRVSDNTTKKFHESQFLSLMRQLKDRTVHVEGDKIVNSDGSTSTATIPPDEQDDDKGRDIKMAGALRPLDDSEQLQP